MSNFQDDDSDRHRGDGDVEGKSWAMDERLQSEMEEAERDADRSWYVLVFSDARKDVCDAHHP